MRKSIAWGAGVLVGVLGVGAAACSSSKSEAHEPGPTAQAGDAGGGDATSPGDGATAELPKPVLCPEANPFAPKDPRSVVVSDVVLKEDTTWTADKIYLIGDDFKIENHKLTVEAGTTICLYQRGKIYVGQGIDPGEIHLNGTKEKPIVITAPPSSNDPTKPDVFHRGIQFDTFQASTISHVNIWYGGVGGGSASPAFELTSASRGTDPAKPLLVDHLTVGAVQTRGLKIATPTGIADGSTIQFTGFVTPDPSGPALDAVAELEMSAIASFAKAFTFAGAPIPDAAKHVNLRIAQAEGKIQKDTDVVDFGLPFHLKNQLRMEIAGAQDDPVGPTLTFHEGVTLKTSAVLVVGGMSGTANGNLVVQGTAAKPVTFTSVEDTPAAGDWPGLYFIDAHYDKAKTKIDHAQILYAGIDDSNPQQVSYHVSRCGSNGVGAVMITGNNLAPYDGPTITNTKIAHSKSAGIVSDSSTSGGYCQTDYTAGAMNVTFEDIEGPQTLTAACP